MNHEDTEICIECNETFPCDNVQPMGDVHICYNCLLKAPGVQIKIVRCMFDEGAGGILEVIKGGDSEAVMELLNKEGNNLEEVFWGVELPVDVGIYIFTGIAIIDSEVGLVFKGEFEKY